MTFPHIRNEGGAKRKQENFKILYDYNILKNQNS